MNTERKPVVVVGSINIDLVVTTDRIPVEGETVAGRNFQTHSGGKGANQAVAVARLGYPVQMIGRVGSDVFGKQLLADLKEAGVDVSAVMISDGASGVASITVTESGQNSIVVVPGANALLTPADLDANIWQLRQAGMVLAQLEVPLATVEHLAQICFNERIPLMLDPAPACYLPAKLFQAVTWFTPNETEAAFYVVGEEFHSPGDSADLVNRLLAKGVDGVVLKQGARGAYLASNTVLPARISPFEACPVDTTAAGDCFNGAFATALLMMKSPYDAAVFAAAAAAISVSRPGAQQSMPTLLEVEQLLRGI